MKTAKIAFAACVLAGVVLFWLYLSAPARVGKEAARGVAADSHLEDAGRGDLLGDSSTNAAGRPDAPPVLLESLVSELAAECRGKRSRDRVLELSGRLKKRVHALSPDEAALAIASLLRSGVDYETGLYFAVGSEGVMDEAPTLRTLLLDLLGQTDPAISAEVSREVLGSTNSADEYALALRNLAWINHDRRLDGELLGWFRGMLGRTEWRAQPSDGFLEAFDAAVDLGAATEMAGVLGSTARDPSSPLDRAAFIALDRITINEPQEVLVSAVKDPSLLAASPMHRASLLARLDIRDPRERETLADYLLSFPHAEGELQYFARIFPNSNRFVGHRLITPSEPVPSIAQIEELDRATLGLLESWAQDPAFASRASELSAMTERLRTGRPPGL